MAWKVLGEDLMVKAGRLWRYWNEGGRDGSKGKTE